MILLPLLIAPAAAGVQGEPLVPHVEPASDEGLRAIAGFQVPPGFEVTQWAAEPMLANPVCLYVDGSGEIYVAETFRHHAGVTDIREHMDWLDDDLAARSVEDRAAYFRKHEGSGYAAYSQHEERIRLIRDSDGDGAADQAVVFADGFRDPMAGIGAGLLSRAAPEPDHPDRREVYYTCIPDLWRLTDLDGDGTADQRTVLQTGFGVHVALLGHDLHGLRVGPDGRLYFSSGDRGFRIELPGGKVIDHTHTGAVLRCELDGSGLEVFASGLRNPQELVFDRFGNLWTGDNNSDGGDKARWVYVVEGSDQGWRYSYQWLTWPNLRGPWNDEKLWYPHFDGQAAYIVPPVANLASGPAGLTYEPGTGFPAEYDDHFFLCDFRGAPGLSGIWTFTVEPAGAGFELGPAEWFLKNVLCTDADFGPDGALYVTDWVEGWNKTGKGRIYRVAPSQEPDPDLGRATARLLAGGLAGLAPGALPPLLDHPDLRVRQQAHLALARQWPRSRSVLLEIAHDPSRSQRARLHALWGLWAALRRTRESAGDLVPLLSDPDPEVRAQTARVLGETELDSPEPLLAALSDPSPRVQAFAAIALGRHRVEKATEPLFALLRAVGEGDPVLRHAAVMGLVGSAGREVLLAAAQRASSAARMGALLALRKLRDPGVAAYLDDGDAALVLEAARAVYDERLGGEAALRTLASWVDRSGLPYPLARRVLNACYRLPDQAGTLADFALGDGDPKLRQEALTLLANYTDPPGRDFVTGAWAPLEPRPEAVPSVVEAVRHLAQAGIGDAPAAVAKEWIELAAAVAPGEHAPRLVDWALDPSKPVTLRAAALRGLGDTLTPELTERLRSALLDPEPEVRAAALTAFRRVAPDDALPVLEDALARGTLPERRAAYDGLGRLPDERAEAVLARELTKLTREEVAAELALDLVQAAEARQSPALDALLELRAAHRADALLAPWLDSLAGGDPARGRALFVERAELSCLRCHRIGDEEGGDVGPDLRGLSRRAAPLDVLSSIVDPNRLVTSGYESESFFLTDGTLVVGRVLTESDELVEVLDADGQAQRLAPDRIEVRKAARSAMPEGLGELVSRSEMRDLIAFLETL